MVYIWIVNLRLLILLNMNKFNILYIIMSFWKRLKIKMCCWSSCSVNDKQKEDIEEQAEEQRKRYYLESRVYINKN